MVCQRLEHQQVEHALSSSFFDACRVDMSNTDMYITIDAVFR